LLGLERDEREDTLKLDISAMKPQIIINKIEDQISIERGAIKIEPIRTISQYVEKNQEHEALLPSNEVQG